MAKFARGRVCRGRVCQGPTLLGAEMSSIPLNRSVVYTTGGRGDFNLGPDIVLNINITSSVRI